MAVNQLKAGAILNYVVLLLNALVGLIYTPFMLRMLGQSEYGLYSLAASIIVYLSMLDLGFGNAVIRYTAKYRAEGKINEQYELFGLFTVLYSIIGVITIVIGLILYFNLDSIFGNTLTEIELKRAEIIFLLLVFNLAITFPLSIYGAIITAYEDFIFLRIVQLIRILVNIMTMVVLLSLGYKAIAMVVVNTLTNLLALLVNVVYCKKRIHVKINFARPDKRFVKELSIYSFWIFLNIIMDRIYWNTGQFILGAVIGTVAVAIYSVALTLKDMYYSFSTAISGVFLPRVTSMVANNCSDKDISDVFIRVGRIQFAMIFYVLSGFILLGRDFIYIWAGEGYDDVYVICLLLFLSTSVPLIQNLGITILQARNQMRYRSIAILIVSLISLLIAVPVAKYYGSVGVAVNFSLAILIGHGLVLNIYYLKYQRIDIVRFWKEIMRMSFFPIVVIFVFYLLFKSVDIDSIWKFGLAVVIFSLFYLPVFYLFSMNASEKELVKSVVKRIL